MEMVVVDNDVVSFLAKGDSREALYSSAMIDKQVCICFQTVAELRLWIIIRRLGQTRSAAIDSVIKRFVVLPYSFGSIRYCKNNPAIGRHTHTWHHDRQIS